MSFLPWILLAVLGVVVVWVVMQQNNPQSTGAVNAQGQPIPFTPYTSPQTAGADAGTAAAIAAAVAGAFSLATSIINTSGK